jgi:hypothetical protein
MLTTCFGNDVNHHCCKIAEQALGALLRIDFDAGTVDNYPVTRDEAGGNFGASYVKCNHDIHRQYFYLFS